MTPMLNADFAALLEGVSRKELEARARKISATYRAGGTSAMIADRMDALAYLVARFPATHAAAHAALRRVAEAAPQFSPSSIIDMGAGPGTVASAACQIFPSLHSVTLIEPNKIFRELARELWPDAQITSGTMERRHASADLVTAGYVLSELDLSQIPRAARELWSATKAMLAVIEPGTPEGFARIAAVRRSLIEDGAHIAAPCTHDGECPMTGSDWCHFSERLARSRDHMIVKSASVPFEDERYAYLAASRAPAVQRRARIVKPVITHKPAILLPLCDGSGIRLKSIPRRDKELFRIARKKQWGDLF